MQNRSQDSESHQKQNVSSAHMFRSGQTIFPLMAGFLTYFTFCQLEPIFALRLESTFQLSKTQIGNMFSVIAFGQLLGGVLVKYIRLNEAHGVILALLASAASLMLIGPAPILPASQYLVFVGCFCSGVFSIFLCVFSLTELTKQFKKGYSPKQEQECIFVCSSTFNCLLGLGQTIGPLYGSFMEASVGFAMT